MMKVLKTQGKIGTFEEVQGDECATTSKMTLQELLKMELPEQLLLKILKQLQIRSAGGCKPLHESAVASLCLIGAISRSEKVRF